MANLIEASTDGLNDLLRNIDVLKDAVVTAQAAGMAQVCIDVANQAKENHSFHNRTGNLEGSIHPLPVEIKDGVVTGYVRAGMEYAAGIEYGNPPHEIPNAFGKGITVNHPGNPPMPFMEPAKQANVKNLIDTMATVTVRAQQSVKVTK